MPPHILVVDDSKAVRRIAEQALASFACTVDEASNGFNGLFAIEKNPPALLLLDVSMPVMDGMEMLTLLKSHPLLQKIPVLMMTSPSDHRVVPQITALGVNDRIMKPFTPEMLVAAVRRILDLKSSEPKT